MVARTCRVSEAVRRRSIMCDKTEGFTVVRHASEVAEIKSFRKHFRLGELWEQGTLGGIP